MLTPLLPHVCFFHFSDTCSLGFHGSTKFWESSLSLIPFQRANLALVLECYGLLRMATNILFNFSIKKITFSLHLQLKSPKNFPLLVLEGSMAYSQSTNHIGTFKIYVVPPLIHIKYFYYMTNWA
jgi:hypothetical protein